MPKNGTMQAPKQKAKSHERNGKANSGDKSPALPKQIAPLTPMDLIIEDVIKAESGDVEARRRLAIRVMTAERAPKPEPLEIDVEDFLGTRVLVIPSIEVDLFWATWPHGPQGWPRMITEIEAETNTRLNDGCNPFWFWRFYEDSKARRDPHSRATFAGYCLRVASDKVAIASADEFGVPPSPLTRDDSATPAEPQGTPSPPAFKTTWSDCSRPQSSIPRATT